METYILRIYRRGKGIPHRIIGIIEESGVEEKKAFTCLDELWRILNPIWVREAPRRAKQRIPEAAKKENHCRSPKVQLLFWEWAMKREIQKVPI